MQKRKQLWIRRIVLAMALLPLSGTAQTGNCRGSLYCHTWGYQCVWGCETSGAYCDCIVGACQDASSIKKPT